MTSRRSFFQRIAAVVALALAPFRSTGTAETVPKRFFLCGCCHGRVCAKTLTQFNTVYGGLSEYLTGYCETCQIETSMCRTMSLAYMDQMRNIAEQHRLEGKVLKCL